MRQTFIVALLLASQAMAWFTWNDKWGSLYISSVNRFDCTPTENNVAPEPDVPIALPATIRVGIIDSDLWEVDYRKVFLQYKIEGQTTWTTFGKVYDNPGRSIFLHPRTNSMGSNTLKRSLAGVDYDTVVYVRLYAGNPYDDTPHENASLDVDTDESGTNGWLDQWVVKFTTASTSRPTLNIAD